MIAIRRAGERGHASLGWLESYHTYSFANYQDPAQMGFRALRVINQDRVQPGHGFPTHPHRDMEIISYVLEGALEHQDSTGSGTVIGPGEVQVMTAGTGIAHSEYNPSQADAVHFLQIWIVPDQPGLPPRFEHEAYSREERQGKLRLIVSSDGRDGSTAIHQDAALSVAALAAGEQVAHAIAPGRYAWVHVARGAVLLNDHLLGEGDGAAVSNEDSLTIVGKEAGDVLVFDLA